MIQSGYCKNVLLLVGDMPTRKIYPKDKSLRMIQGDAGSATIISASENSTKSAFNFFSDGKGFNFLYVPAGGMRIPIEKGRTDVEQTDEQGNIHTLESVHMNGLEIMTFAVNSAPRSVNNVLDMLEWNKNDIDMFVFHQANKFMIDSLRKRLRVPQEKVPIQVEKYGNVGNGTIPLALCEENFPTRKKTDKIVLCAFGGGLSCATVALDLKKTCFCKLIEYEK